MVHPVQSSRSSRTHVAVSPCCICGAMERTSFGRYPDNRFAPAGPAFELTRCAGCGLVSTAGELEDDAYPQEYAAFQAPRARGTSMPSARQGRRGPAHLLRHRFAWVHRLALPSRPRVLDVGCGSGALSLGMRDELGWEVVGLEPSCAAYEAAQQAGLDVHLGTLESRGGELGDFDLVVFTHVLEHVSDPVADLQRAREITRPGGHCVVSVPNVASVERRLLGRSWDAWDLPRHRTHFEPRTLILAMEQAGWDPGEVGFERYSVLARSLCNALWPGIPYESRMQRLKLRRLSRALGTLLGVLGTSSAMTLVGDRKGTVPQGPQALRSTT